jgi:predicted nucleic acid-binding Zn ribbon protein
MKQISKPVEQFLRRCNLWNGYRQHLLIYQWNIIVGPALAEVTRADNINNGVLKVAVKDSVWAYHLSMMKPSLISKLNNYSGSKMVKDIVFIIDDLRVFDKK